MRSGLGATWLGEDRCRFVVWAPHAAKVEVRVLGPQPQTAMMEKLDRGYYEAVVEGMAPGSDYVYRLDAGEERPDPASRFQPQGVHGASQVVDTQAFAWGDDGWRGLPLEKYLIYELHVGTFTPEGAFDGVIPHLDELKDLGITAVELMPVAQFPGSRNWGYDGVYPFAVQASYGGPEGLKRLINACHQREIAVALDVVYNHLGPEGNYLGDFGPYFSDRYRTPWGGALNFDGPDGDGVRRHFIENTRAWVRDFHLDGLRLDAIHAIYDASPVHILTEITAAAREEARLQGRPAHIMAESHDNDRRIVLPPEAGGIGLDAVWSDDFHHALHVRLTGERGGYYADFTEPRRLPTALAEGFAFQGEYSEYFGRDRGTPSADLPGERFVICAESRSGQIGRAHV